MKKALLLVSALVLTSMASHARDLQACDLDASSGWAGDAIEIKKVSSTEVNVTLIKDGVTKKTSEKIKFTLKSEGSYENDHNEERTYVRAFTSESGLRLELVSQLNLRDFSISPQYGDMITGYCLEGHKAFINPKY